MEGEKPGSPWEQGAEGQGALPATGEGQDVVMVVNSLEECLEHYVWVADNLCQQGEWWSCLGTSGTCNSGGASAWRGPAMCVWYVWAGRRNHCASRVSDVVACHRLWTAAEEGRVAWQGKQGPG